MRAPQPLCNRQALSGEAPIDPCVRVPQPMSVLDLAGRLQERGRLGTAAVSKQKQTANGRRE